MKIAIVTDIHEDFAMLEKAISAIKVNGYDLLVCLGDITGFAPTFYNHLPDANACLDLLKSEADIVLAGNHDLFSIQKLPSYHLEKNIPSNWHELSPAERKSISGNKVWLYEDEVLPELTLYNEKYLSSLNDQYIFETGNSRIMFSHFVYPDIAGFGQWFPYHIWELWPHFNLMKANGCNIGFVGHFHPEKLTVVRKFFWSNATKKDIVVDRKPAIIFCPPVVRGKFNSGCVIFDTSNNRLLSVYI